MTIEKLVYKNQVYDLKRVDNDKLANALAERCVEEDGFLHRNKSGKYAPKHKDWEYKNRHTDHHHGHNDHGTRLIKNGHIDEKGVHQDYTKSGHMDRKKPSSGW